MTIFDFKKNISGSVISSMVYNNDWESYKDF